MEIEELKERIKKIREDIGQDTSTGPRIKWIKASCGSPASGANLAPCEIDSGSRYSVAAISGITVRSPARICRPPIVLTHLSGTSHTFGNPGTGFSSFSCQLLRALAIKRAWKETLPKRKLVLRSKLPKCSAWRFTINNVLNDAEKQDSII